MFAKQKFWISYVYKIIFFFYRQVMFTKQTNVCKTKMYRQVMFTKEKLKFAHTLCLLNKTEVDKHVMFTKPNTKQKFTNTLCLQNKTNDYNTNVYKTKVYKHVMFTKQNTKQKVYNNNKKFTNTLCLQNKIPKFKQSQAQL